MKKLLNAMDAVVPEMLSGVAMLHPGLALLEGHTVALRADVQALKARGEVTLISGGGSGHEPAHAGYIGPGLLTAAVAGDVFTSPSTDAVLAAIEAVAGPAGVLLIVKNYTGDRLNFGLAAEIARSHGHAVEMVVVDDDASLSAKGAHAGRRGIAGTVLVHKVAGAAAAAGASLAQVKAAAEKAIAAVSTMGLALTPCTVPAAGKPSFELGPDEIELGLGIHGEPGVRRTALQPADALVATLLDTLVADQSLARGDRVALLVNNLGATPSLELSIVTGSALRQLAQRGVQVERAWSGTFLTALEMAGVSLSLMRLDDELLRALDAHAQAAAWPAAHLGRVTSQVPTVSSSVTAPPTARRSAGVVLSAPGQRLQQAMWAVAQALEDAETELTTLDQRVGDGDLGISLARGARALRADEGGYPLDDLPATLQALSATLRKSLGGTSGPLYAIGLLCAAEHLKAHPDQWGPALRAAADGISRVGNARQGDCTMLDALYPAAEALSATGQLSEAVQAAQQGTQSTAERIARQGRASYLAERAVGHVDPGAHAVTIWLQALQAHLSASGRT